MKVLFVYSTQKTITAQKPLAGQEGIQFGISLLSAVLKRNQHETSLVVLDRKHGNKNLKKIDSRIAEFNPELICFTSVYSEFDFICEVATHIKKNHSSIPLMCGGVHITLNPSVDLLNIFDCLCVGEGEDAISEYVACLQKGYGMETIPNLWLKHNNQIIRNAPRNFIADLDTLPMPDRTIWQEWILESNTRLTLLLGRGCPYNCTYCCNHKLKKVAGGKYVRLRSAENIITELQTLHQQFPSIKEYFLEVETIGCDSKWLVKLCDSLAEFNLSTNNKLKFGTNLRIFPNMDFELIFTELIKASFDSVIIGLESGNYRIRKEILNREYSNELVLHAVETARKHGIKIGIFNMIGIPTETKEDFNDTVSLNRIIKPEWHSTSIFFPYKGTRLYDLSNELGLLPKSISTVDERQIAVLNLPGFSKKEIQRSFDSFHLNVYTAYENKSAIKLGIYFVMQYIGHNAFADLKLTVIRLLYKCGLYNIAKSRKLFGVFQKS